MYWFFNCNNYEPKAIKALVYSAYTHNPHFKSICVWDEPEYPNPQLKVWLEDRGVLVYPYVSTLGSEIFKLSQQEGFIYEKWCDNIWVGLGEVSLNGMWSKADIPLICDKLGVSDEFVLVTDPDCIFVAKYDLDIEWSSVYVALAAGPEEEPYREWISGGIYVFNIKRMLEDREDFEEWVIENYKEIGYAENLSFLNFYSYKNIAHISPDWNYKPFWEKERDYLISPVDRAIFRATPKLIHFQGIYKPWDNPPIPENTDMKYYCDLWHEFVKLSETSFKFTP